MKVAWIMLGCALGACGGRASSSSAQTVGGGATMAESMPEPRDPREGSGRANEPSEASGGAAGPTAAGSGAGGLVVGIGGASESGGAAGDYAAGIDGGTSSQAGVGGSGEPTGEFPPRAVCGPTLNDFNQIYCPDLEALSISLAAIEDAGGDGAVSPGEEARAVFSLANGSSQNFVQSPCVGMLAAIPGFTVLESYNPSAHLYGVNKGSVAMVKLRFRVEQWVAPGTRIPVLAWLDVQHTLCPNGDELRFELVVAP